MEKQTQKQQVIDALRAQGGYATLRRLYEVIDFSTWKTKTPDATVRQIVQQSKSIFRIQPGLWALEESRDKVLKHFNLQLGNPKSEEVFTHGYYQGLLIEIGKFKGESTYIPAQDKKRLFLGNEIGNMADAISIPEFTYEHLLRKAKTIDVIWFNKRVMPSHFYEVEHTTDIKNSLSKFYELQDFAAQFYIVADKSRQREFEDKINVSMFKDIEKRVKFLNYDDVVRLYNGLNSVKDINEL